MDATYPRDLRGYGPTPPDPVWPGGARVAVQFVINYEEGAENSVLHGDAGAETFLSEIIGAQPVSQQRHMSMESLYDYGARMMSVGLHCRLAGRPGRAGAVARFLDYVGSFSDAWIASRIDIAEHWRTRHPPRP